MSEIYCNGEHASFPADQFEVTAEFGLIHKTAIPHTVNGDPLSPTSWALPTVSPKLATEVESESWTSLSGDEPAAETQVEGEPAASE